MKLFNKANQVIRSLGLTAAAVLMGVNIQAQTINESFADITTLPGAGWSLQNLSDPVGTIGWFQGDASSTVFGPYSPTGYIGANFNSVAASGLNISNWLISPTRTYTNGDVVTFYSRTTTGPTYADRLEVRLSTSGASSDVGTTDASVGDFTTLLLTINPTLIASGVGSYPDTWTQFTATISGLAAPTSGRVAFRYFVVDGGPNGNFSDFIGIDDVYIGPSLASAPEVAVAHTTPRQYTQIPLSQVTSMAISATVNNTGTAVAANVTATTNIFLAPNMTTPVQTLSGSTTNLAAAGTATIALGNFTPSAVGSYTIQHIISGNTGAMISNDTATFSFAVTDATYARDNADLSNGVNISAAYGIGAGPVGYTGALYDFTTAANLDSVLVALNKPGSEGLAIGDSTRVVVFNVAAGIPSTQIGTSPVYIFTAADTLGVVVNTHKVMTMAGANLILTPGTYYIGIAEYQTNIGIAVTDNIFNSNTFYAAWTGQAFTDLASFGGVFAKTSIIRPKLGCAPATSTDVQTACASLVWIDGVTYTTSNNSATHTIVGGAADGCDSIVTLDLTINTITGTDVQASCDSLVWIDGVTYSANNNTATHTIVGGAANGCDSIVTLDLTINTVNTGVSLAGITLTATATGATYQWVDCNNANAPISGETAQSFTATANGDYAVEVTENGCTVLSACTNILVSNIQSLSDGTAISIYPNPTKDNLTVDFGTSVEDATVRLFSLDGRLLEQFNAVNGNQFTLSLESYPAALYFIEVATKDAKNAVLKVSKF